MPRAHERHLRVIGSSQAHPAGDCRTVGCAFPRQGALGFCDLCEAVYRAALALREQLLARRIAQLRRARPLLFAAMTPENRERLLAHLAAESAHRGQHASVFAGLEDFLGELRDIGIGEQESPA
jgi:hypothetical protein